MDRYPTVATIKEAPRRGVIRVPVQLAKKTCLLVFTDGGESCSRAVRRHILQTQWLVYADAGNDKYTEVLDFLIMAGDRLADPPFGENPLQLQYRTRLSKLSQEHKADVMEAVLADVRSSPEDSRLTEALDRLFECRLEVTRGDELAWMFWTEPEVVGGTCAALSED